MIALVVVFLVLVGFLTRDDETTLEMVVPTDVPPATVATNASPVTVATNAPPVTVIPVIATTVPVRPSMPSDPFIEPLQAAILAMDNVVSVDMTNIMGNADDGWLVGLEVIVAPGSNTLEMAEALFRQTGMTLASARFDFTAILNDGETAIDYARWTYNDEWIVTEIGGG